MNEADTCRPLVLPNLESSGWDGGRHFYSEQTSLTDGRIIVPAGKPRRLKRKFSDFLQWSSVVDAFEEREIDIQELTAQAGHPDAAPFDLLCHLAFNAPLLTRKQRAEKLRKEKHDFFAQYGSEANAILEEVLNKYAEHGTSQFSVPDVLEVPPISTHGNAAEIAKKFGGVNKLNAAISQLQMLLYAA